MSEAVEAEIIEPEEASELTVAYSPAVIEANFDALEAHVRRLVAGSWGMAAQPWSTTVQPWAASCCKKGSSTSVYSLMACCLGWPAIGGLEQ